MCIMYMCAHIHLKRPGEGVRFPGAGVPGGYEPSNLGTRNQTCKSSKYSCQLSHLSNPVLPILKSLAACHTSLVHTYQHAPSSFHVLLGSAPPILFPVSWWLPNFNLHKISCTVWGNAGSCLGERPLSSWLLLSGHPRTLCN